MMEKGLLKAGSGTKTTQVFCIDLKALERCMRDGPLASHKRH